MMYILNLESRTIAFLIYMNNKYYHIFLTACMVIYLVLHEMIWCPGCGASNCAASRSKTEANAGVVWASTPRSGRGASRTILAEPCCDLIITNQRRNKLRWYPQLTAATFYFYKSFWGVLRSQGLKTPQRAPKPPRPSSEPCWTWPGSAPKPPGTFSGTFSGTLLNLTWLCTKASQTFSGTFSGTLFNLTWLCTKASLVLHQDFLEPSPEPSPEPVEPDQALHQSLPDLLRNLALHQSIPDLLGNLRNLLPNLVEPDPAPAPAHTGAVLGWRAH